MVNFDRGRRVLTFVVLMVVMSLESEKAIARDDSCTARLPFKPRFSLEKCHDAWPGPSNFIVRSSRTQSSKSNHSLLNVILSAKQDSQWIGIGFSKDGMMQGSSAVVGWPGVSGGKPVLKPYYLEVPSPTGVIVDVNGTHVHLLHHPVVVLDESTLYLAFQIDLNMSSASFAYTLYAIGPAGHLPGDDFVLPHHINATAVPSSF